MRLNFTSGHKDSFYFFIRGILAHTINFRVCVISLRVRPRFFDQVGHETIYASSGNKHFFIKSCHCQTYQNYEHSRQRLGPILENKVP